MHRVAWALAGVAVVLCAVSAFVDGPWSIVTAAAAVLLLGGWLAVGWVNGRSLEQRWQRRGVRGEFVIERAVAEFTDDGHTRFSIDGHVDAGASGRYEAFVRTADAHLITDGARLPATVLADDPGTVRLHLRPPGYVVLQARPGGA